MTRSEVTREKSRSCVTRAAALIARALAACTASAELETERSPQSRSAFRNVDVERDRLPGSEDGTIAARERVVGGPQRTGQDLGDGDRRDGEAQTPGRMRLEDRPEARAEDLMAFEDVDDRRQVHKEQCLLRQIVEP